MKVCYIVLTCEKYLNTRVKWQMETMFKNIDKDDIYYLGHTNDKDNRLFSWGALDDYNNLPFKFIDFFKNIELNYDWYFFIDDDTFVFHDNLYRLLSNYKHTDYICIGKQLDHIKNTCWGLYMSGGAGTIISNVVYKDICAFILSKDRNEVAYHWCADICLGMWTKKIGNVLFVDNINFHTDMYNKNTDNLNEAITFHHLKNKDDYTQF